MLDQPYGAELLEEARRTLLENLLPVLPPDRRYDALMVANAMAIAAREASEGNAADRRAHEELLRLTGATPESEDSRDLDVGGLTELERHLAQQIRIGAFDAPGSRRDAVLGYLRRSTIARLRISNPKAFSP